MTKILLIVLCLSFLTYVAYNEYKRRQYIKSETAHRKFVSERLDEIEQYAYTDIRELMEFLDKVKVDYAKTRKN